IVGGKDSFKAAFTGSLSRRFRDAHGKPAIFESHFAEVRKLRETGSRTNCALCCSLSRFARGENFDCERGARFFRVFRGNSWARGIRVAFRWIALCALPDAIPRRRVERNDGSRPRGGKNCGDGGRSQWTRNHNITGNRFYRGRKRIPL